MVPEQEQQVAEFKIKEENSWNDWLRKPVQVPPFPVLISFYFFWIASSNAWSTAIMQANTVKTILVLTSTRSLGRA